MRKVTLRKRSEKAVTRIFEKKQQQEMLERFFKDIWDKIRPEYRLCQECGKHLGVEPRTYFFDHLLEKSRYPEYMFDEENIFMCCFECHNKKTNGHPGPKHEQAILNFKRKIKL